MSLIDEALKRAQAGEGRESAISPAPGFRSPSRWTAPAPLPDRRRRAWRGAAVGAVAATGALILAGVLLLSSRGAGGARPSAPTRMGSGATAPPAPARESAARSSAGAATAQPAAEPAKSDSARIARAPSRRGGFGAEVETAAAAAPHYPTKESEAASRPAGASASSEERKRPDEERSADSQRTHFGEATLPGGRKLELGGIVWSEERPVALVNGRVLPAGAVVDGCTILEIREDRVEFGCPSRTIVITLK